MNMALCIPTYKRPHLLRLLLEDVARQSLRPDRVIVVDGDPASGEVLRMLADAKQSLGLSFFYVPSLHPNLAYQRYLGSRAAAGMELLVYLDDDLRIANPHSLENLLKPLLDQASDYVAGTGTIVFGDGLGEARGVIADRIRDSDKGPAWGLRLLGTAARTAPGGLTPSGNRVPPVQTGEPTADVQWLRGGAMAFRVAILGEDFFSDDLFALTRIGCGLGEDTFLGRRALCFGRLYAAFDATFEHPNADEPKAYPTQAFRNGFATAYSRRFINDHYRGFEPPSAQERLLFLKGLAGIAGMALARALRSPSQRRFAYLLGCLKGALLAVVSKPTSTRLCPGVEWRSDAAKCLEAGSYV